ncbi:MAG: NUDIX hydrolase [Euzebya sp.]
MVQRVEEQGEPQVRAAGGVVWRRDSTGRIEVLVVHRPRYDDWSLPKGKLDQGESFSQAAIREIAEETGIHGTLGQPLGEVRYLDHQGRSKVVKWWAVEAPQTDEEGEPSNPDEIDDMRWVELSTADDLVSYPTDRQVLARFHDTVMNR